MKKILMCLLCLGMIVGCSNSAQPSLEEDFKDNEEIINTANSIISNYKESDINLNYAKKTTGSELNAYYNNGDCEVKMIFNYDEKFLGIELTDNKILDTYSKDYIDTIKATLLLDVYDIDSNIVEKIASFFNENNDSKANINGYQVEVNHDSFTIMNATIDSLLAYSEEDDPTIKEEENVDKIEEQENIATIGQSNALKSAYSYLDMGGFSKESLNDQLEYEGYSKDEIEYALEHCNANWKEQAAQSAKNYLNSSSFSKQELREQLDYEGFTKEQIDYALEEVGY